MKQMWKQYEVKLEMAGRFAAALPRTREEIQAMLEARQPSEAELRRRTAAGENIVPLEELGEEVAEAVGVEEEPKEGWATFPRDEKGLYYEGRCVRGHLKDCAAQVASFFPQIRNFRAKFVNRVYVETERIHLGKTEPDGTELRYVQAMTRRGPRSTPKHIDYVEGPQLTFVLRVLNDGVIGEEELKAVFEYGSTHGMGQERSQDYGRYKVAGFREQQTSGGRPRSDVE